MLVARGSPPAAVPLVANLAALIMEIGAAVPLATLFAVVRRQVKPRAYFELWERAWTVLALSLVLLLARHIPGVPPLLGLLGYQVGKFAFFGLLLLGALAYQRPDRLLPVRPATALMAFLGVVTAGLSDNPNTAVAWQSPFALVLCGVSAWRLAALPGNRRTFGTHATSGAMLVYAR